MRAHGGIMVAVVMLLGPVSLYAQAPPANGRPELLPDPTALTTLPPVPSNRPTVLPDSIPQPESPSQIVLNLEYRFQRPRRQAAAIAIVDPNTDDIPEGTIESVLPGMSSGFRAAIGYIPRGSPWQTSFAYTYFRSTDLRDLVAPAGGLLFTTMTRPGLIVVADTANAAANWAYDLYDLELGRNVTLDPTLGFRAQVGGRIASIGHELGVLYDGGDADLARAITASHFTGAGIIFGGEVHWTAGRGLSFFGRARAGLMLGASSFHILETQSDDTVLHTDVTERTPQTTPMLEMGIGASYRFRGLTVRGGYDIANWFQLFTIPDFADDVNIGKLVRRQTNFSLDGFFVQLGYNF